MKNIFKLSLVLGLFTMAFTACDKADSLTHYNNGSAPSLTASATTLTPAASDSLRKVLTLNWSSPAYASDSATYKYTIEMDSAGRNFSKAYTRTLTGARMDTFTAKQLNDILLGWGFMINTAYDVDVRVTSSYANNNERLQSNTVRIKMTAYKIPPKVALPASGRLFITGDAVPSGWINPVPASQELTKIDSVTWGGIFSITGGKEYLILPVNGDWSMKYSVANKSVTGLSAGGDFGYNLADNVPGPATSGTYKLVINFQTGKFTMTPYTGALPNNMFITGDAVASGWTNPVPTPSQQFTRTTNSTFELTIPMVANKQYLWLPVNGDWSMKFAVASNSQTGLAAGGDFGYYTSGGENFPGPAVAGNYKLVANLLTYKFSVTKL